MLHGSSVWQRDVCGGSSLPREEPFWLEGFPVKGVQGQICCCGPCRILCGEFILHSQGHGWATSPEPRNGRFCRGVPNSTCFGWFGYIIGFFATLRTGPWHYHMRKGSVRV